MLLLMIITAQVFGTIKTDKTTEKARAMVEKAAPHDWECYAKAAKMCIKKSVNLQEAKEWIDTSLEIKDSALGNEVAGDYFMSNKLYNEAIKYYVKSMLIIKDGDFYADTSQIELKIETAKEYR